MSVQLILEFPDDETREIFIGLWLDGGMSDPFFDNFDGLTEDFATTKEEKKIEPRKIVFRFVDENEG